MLSSQLAPLPGDRPCEPDAHPAPGILILHLSSSDEQTCATPARTLATQVREANEHAAKLFGAKTADELRGSPLASLVAGLTPSRIRIE